MTSSSLRLCAYQRWTNVYDKDVSLEELFSYNVNSVIQYTDLVTPNLFESPILKQCALKKTCWFDFVI